MTHIFLGKCNHQTHGGHFFDLASVASLIKELIWKYQFSEEESQTSKVANREKVAAQSDHGIHFLNFTVVTLLLLLHGSGTAAAFAKFKKCTMPHRKSTLTPTSSTFVTTPK